MLLFHLRYLGKVIRYLRNNLQIWGKGKKLRSIAFDPPLLLSWDPSGTGYHLLRIDLLNISL